MRDRCRGLASLTLLAFVMLLGSSVSTPAADAGRPARRAAPRGDAPDRHLGLGLGDANKVRAYDAASGDVVWETPGMTQNAIPTPAYDDGLLILTSGFRGNALLAVNIAEALAGGGGLRALSARPQVPLQDLRVVARRIQGGRP